MRHISDLKKELERLIGIEVSIDQIRKLEKRGLVKCTRESKGCWRLLTEEDFKTSMKYLLLYYFNVPIEDILTDDSEIFCRWIKKIRRTIYELKKMRP